MVFRQAGIIVSPPSAPLASSLLLPFKGFAPKSRLGMRTSTKCLDKKEVPFVLRVLSQIFFFFNF